jgi:hypothetical protein
MAETKTARKATTASRGRTRATAERPEEPTPTAGAAPTKEHVCNVAFCPIGLALSSVQGTAPDVLEHLLKAGQEFFLAMRAVVDNRAKDFEGAPSKDTMQRIEIS